MQHTARPVHPSAYGSLGHRATRTALKLRDVLLVHVQLQPLLHNFWISPVQVAEMGTTMCRSTRRLTTKIRSRVADAAALAHTFVLELLLPFNEEFLPNQKAA